MSWADDIRCLYCDGRLPLYRKITNGQFCSKAHRQSYWQEQERLAVERLHQTHNSLRAYRPPGAVEAILGDAAAADEGDTQFDVAPPALAGLLQNAVLAMPQWLPDYVAAIDVAPMEPARMLLRTPVILWATREYALGTGSHVFLPLPAAAGYVMLAAAIEPIQSGSRHAHHPTFSSRLDFAPRGFDPQNSDTPRIDELMVLGAAPIPELASLVAMALPALRDYAVQIVFESSYAESAVRLHFPRQLAGGIRTLGRAARVGMSFSGLPVTVARTPSGAFNQEGLHALDLRIESTRLELSSPPFRPRLNLACGSRYKVETRQNAPASIAASAVTSPVAAAVDVPAEFVAMPPQISLPEHKGRTFAAAAAAGKSLNSLALTPKGAPAEKPATVPLALHPDFEPSPTGLLPLACAAQPKGSETAVRPVPAAVLLPQPPRAEVSRPVSHLSPIDSKPTSDAIVAANPMEPPAPHLPKAHLLTHAIDFWNRAPRDLKILAFALPILLGLTLHPSLPKVHATAPAAAAGVQKNLEHVFNTQWANVRQTVVDRAAVALNEDFRSGLDDWTSRGDATAEWSFDATGFVRPGPLALYRPSMELSDYQVQFLGMIDKQALSWVARAADYDNFYVIKLEVLKSGPLPTIGITRYAVVNGVADTRVDSIAPIDARADMLYRVRLDVRGDDFALSVQGQMVDSWSEPRLRHGGIGFFSGRGEESRIRWVQVTHQYDMLGRLCAYLAPYNIPSASEGLE